MFRPRHDLRALAAFQPIDFRAGVHELVAQALAADPYCGDVSLVDAPPFA